MSIKFYIKTFKTNFFVVQAEKSVLAKIQKFPCALLCQHTHSLLHMQTAQTFRFFLIKMSSMYENCGCF